jgi:hypothetical protein
MNKRHNTMNALVGGVPGGNEIRDRLGESAAAFRADRKD